MSRSEYGDDSDWLSPGKSHDVDVLDLDFKDIKLKWREGRLNAIKTYRRQKADPEHNGDNSALASTFSPIKRRPVLGASNSDNVLRRSLDQDINTFYSSLFETPATDGAKANSSESPKRGRIRPKSASFQNTYNRHKVLERSFSGRCIKEKLRRDESEKYRIAFVVAEREKWMKERLLLCIDEANVFSRHLQDPYVYKIHLKIEDHHLYDITLQKYLAGSRYDQIYIEVINLDNSDDRSKKKEGSLLVSGVARDGVRLMSAERFFEEHARLFAEIKKRRSLMAKSEATAERLRDKRSIATDQRQTYTGPCRDSNVEKSCTEKDVAFDGSHFVKEKAYEKLRSILLNVIDCTKELEDQYKEIKARGWNTSHSFL